MIMETKTTEREEMTEPEDIQICISSETSAEAPALIDQDEEGKGETQKNCTKRLKSCWQAFLIGVFVVLLCSVTGVLISKQTMVKHMDMENNLLKQTSSLLRGENDKLKLLLNATMEENTRLRVKLNMSMNSTLENCHLVEEEKRHLDLLLNESLHAITLASAESKELRQLLNSERQTSMQLGAENQHQRSILYSDNLSFLWRLCDKNTLECSRCLHGWAEHDSRCFLLSQGAKKWEAARRECLDMAGDLAVVLNAEDQAFLTNLTFQFAQQHPQEDFHSAWIGLQDMVKEGDYIWVTGERIQPNTTYWMPGEPNNAMASWDSSQTGQDCVAIVSPKSTEEEDWLYSWDDIICGGKRHYICETMALNLT